MTMYRLLIVDDEPDVADGLYTILRNTEGLELEISRAYSAYEALEILNNTRIDILMTDILMPGMTGLKLVERVKSNWPRCRVIFLTGHNEFDYIYSAMRFEGADYLLKTESFERIVESIENAAAWIDNETKVSELEARANKYLRNLIPYMQKEYVSSLISEGETSARMRGLQFKELKIPLDAEKPVLLMLGRVAGMEKPSAFLKKAQLLLTIKEIAESHFSPLLTTHFTALDKFLILWMIQPADYDDSGYEESQAVLPERLPNIVKGCAETIQNICLDSLKLGVSFIVDNKAIPWEALPARYDSLKLLLLSHIGCGSDVLLLDGEKALDSAGDSLALNVNKIRLLETYLECGQRDEFFRLLSDMTGRLGEIESKHYNPSLELFYSISVMFLSYINRNSLTEKLAFKIGLSRLTHVEEHASWRDAVCYFKDLAEILFAMRNTDVESSAEAAVNRIKQYIAEHLSEDLSLSRLAEMVYFNPSYLSRLFRQITGSNLLSYINHARIEKAKELLRGKEVKIYEVASAVGYESPSYFTQFFKKTLKMSPQEYRDKMHK